MMFTEKLRKLTEGANKSKVAQDAGMRGPAISDLINKGNEPKAITALRIARALKVPLEWLVDDEQGWPPPDKKELSANILTEHELIDALTRIWIFEWQKLKREGEYLLRVDWAPPVKAVYRAIAEGKKPPADAMELVRRAQRFEENIWTFQPRFDLEHKANMYDFFRGKPKDECESYSPNDLEALIRDLKMEPMFTNALNAVLLDGEKGKEQAKRELKDIESVDRAVPAEHVEKDEDYFDYDSDELKK